MNIKSSFTFIFLFALVGICCAFYIPSDIATGNGANLIHIQASALEGTIDDSLLSGNIPLLNTDNTFSGVLYVDDLVIQGTSLYSPTTIHSFYKGVSGNSGQPIWGPILSSDLPVGVPTVYRAGQQAIASLSTSQAVTFSSPLSPSLGTNYAVSVTADGTLAAAVGFGITSKTTNGFTITLSGGVTGGVTVDYHVLPNL